MYEEKYELRVTCTYVYAIVQGDVVQYIQFVNLNSKTYWYMYPTVKHTFTLIFLHIVFAPLVILFLYKNPSSKLELTYFITLPLKIKFYKNILIL